MADNHDALIAQFADITGALPAEARNHLEANAWDIGAATIEYFTAMDEEEEGDDADPAPEEPYTGPRTLDGRPAPQSVSAAAASSRSAPPKQKGVATLGSLGSGGHAHDDDDDSDSEDERDQPRDLFAGGEKSALAVQDPSKKKDSKGLIKEILKKAQANAGKHGESSSSAASAAPSRFSGTGHSLGDDNTPSQAIPSARAPEESEHVTRVLHIWEDGFSIEDGELKRFDDPRNARDLQMIQQGRAPLHLMGVRPDQSVDVQLNQHKEKYTPPPKVYKPFGGSGQRLGSPTPGGSSTATETAPSAATAAPVQTSTSSRPEPEIDSSQPTVTLRLQLADGTRMPARFNTTNTIGDVYAFVERATTNSGREWVIATTFPNKDHTDKSLKLEDVPEFKRGGNAVQKWV